jgi:mRNA-degrading endonuclease YafQ of YafQ-DinJ toxin-antitoxin module
MRVGHITTTRTYDKDVLTLPPLTRNPLRNALCLFLDDPFHPSLRLHKLSGKLKSHWSIFLDLRHRVIFRHGEKSGEVILISVGTHAIYE